MGRVLRLSPEKMVSKYFSAIIYNHVDPSYLATLLSFSLRPIRRPYLPALTDEEMCLQVGFCLSRLLFLPLPELHWLFFFLLSFCSLFGLPGPLG